MLINFSIKNFGSIKDKQTLSFEADKSKHLEDYYVIQTNGLRLLKLGLIYGANASGKTTILKALDFLRTLILNPKMQKNEIFNFEPFLFDEKSPNENTIFEIDFLQNNVRYFYSIEFNKKAVINEELYYFSPKKSNVFKRNTDLKSELTSISFGNKSSLNKIEKKSLEINTLWNNTVLGGFLKINFVSKELKDVTDWFGKYLTQLIYPYSQLKDYFDHGIYVTEIEKKTIIEILKKADFNISDFYFKENIDLLEYLKKKSNLQSAEFEEAKKWGLFGNDNFFNAVGEVTLPDLDFEHTINGKKYLLSFDSESIGTQRYYTFACLLSKLINSSISMSIDELESSLHPDLFQHFLLSFLVNSKKSQLLATTHNREILNNKDIFRNDTIWITDKDNENCATELYSLADFATSVIRDTTNIYNAYKIGKLGGTPNLGSFYINIDNEAETE